MGWASGSQIVENLIYEFKSILAKDTRQLVYESLIREFEEADCDTLCECLGVDPVFDQAMKNVSETPDDFDDLEYGDEEDEGPMQSNC